MRLFVLSAIALMAFSGSALADPVSYTAGSVKAGAEAASNSIGGNSAGTSAAVSFRTAQIGSSSRYGEEFPTHWLEADAQYNMIGGSNEGVTMGLRGHFSGLFAGTNLARNATGCDFYYGVGGDFDGSAQLHRVGQTQARLVVGTETGLFCQTRDILFMVSPVAGLGYTAVATESDLEATNNNFLRAGARARMVLDQKLAVSGSVMHAPKIVTASTDSDDRFNSTEGQVNAEYKADRWVFGGYVKGIKMHDTLGEKADFKGVEGGVLAGTAF